MSAPDQSPKAGLGEPLPVGPTDASPTAALSSPIPPRNWLELIYYAIQSWRHTLRLVVLSLTAALCIASVMFVIQLHPERWGSVAVIAASVITAVGVGRLRRSARAASKPPNQE